jgi:hypothetical protein
MSISVDYARKNAQLLPVHLLRDEIEVPEPDLDPAKEAERLQQRDLSPLKISSVDVCTFENIKIKERLVHSLDLQPETAVMHGSLFVSSLDTLRQSVQRYSITP